MSINKKEFFLKQGYEKEHIDTLDTFGVSTHMLWFLNIFSKNPIPIIKALETEIRMVNEHIIFLKKNKFRTFEQAYTSAKNFNEEKKRFEKNTLHKFEDGYYIVNLTTDDLQNEASMMSNCVVGYTEKIATKECALLALKNKKHETLVHFQVQKNGLISQNYEKANMGVRNKNWKYVYSFFEKNSKNVDVSKYFDFTWELKSSEGRIFVDYVLPKSMHSFIDKRTGEKKTEIEECSTIKRFETRFNSFSKASSKEDIKFKLLEIKRNINDGIDDLIRGVELTEAKNLYLSDEMKEKIFGKNRFYMKGNEYNFNDIIFGFYGDDHGVQAFEEHVEFGEAMAIEEENFEPMIEPEFDRDWAEDEPIHMPETEFDGDWANLVNLMEPLENRNDAIPLARLRRTRNVRT